MSLQDSLIDYNESLLFHEKANSRYKSLKAFRNGYHNIFDDNESEEAKSFILEWCNERLLQSKDFSRYF